MERVKRIGLRLGSYGVVGIFATLGVIITWNILYIVARALPFEQNLVFSVTQYIAAAIWIFPSFYANRKLTFRDKSLTSSKKITAGKVLIIYTFSPLLASFATYMVQVILGQNIESFTIELASFSIPYLYFALQLFGIGISFVTNFFGQYFLVYTSREHVQTASESISE